MPGTAPTSASWRSSTVLMKCAWPRTTLTDSGFSPATVTSSIDPASLPPPGLAQRLDEGVDVEGGKGHDLHAPPRGQLGRHARHGQVVGRLDNVDEVVRSQRNVLRRHTDPKLFQLGVDL